MKTIIYTLLIIMSGIGMISCSSDDNNDTPPVITTPDYEVTTISSRYDYVLTSFSGGISIRWYRFIFESKVKNNTDKDANGQIMFNFENKGSLAGRYRTIKAKSDTIIKDTARGTLTPEDHLNLKVVKTYFHTY